MVRMQQRKAAEPTTRLIRQASARQKEIREACRGMFPKPQCCVQLLILRAAVDDAVLLAALIKGTTHSHEMILGAS